jgi:hypothetical protein
VDDDSSSKTGKGTQVVVTPAVAATGDVADVSGVNTGAVAGAGLALVLAATGVVVVAKKNKE